MTGFSVIIPARYESSRLPGKVLLPLAGKPMIEHVHGVALASGARRVLVATDDSRVEQACRGFGAEVMLTGADHQSGTDRLAECVQRLELADDEVVVNLQGDEPLMPPSQVNRVAAALLEHGDASIATLCSVITSGAELHDPNAVKVVMDRNGFALYFSRAPIPWDRDAFTADPTALSGATAYRHIGIYAYRAGYLKTLSALPPAPLEVSEKLEQLRALADGARIHVSVVTEAIPAGVDTRSDLQRVEALLGQ
ncbi:MAG: 3-deoxy-manno-octulosonate cytidylyltransferase [Xanthomonadales bacterium]|nr:3-deoxy-manno-octulosonate cytidylyltransferase [Xanthomonadales bacterium]